MTGADLTPAGAGEGLVPARYAEKAMASLMQLHTELMDEKERRVELFRRLMEKEQTVAELRMYVKLLEEKLGEREPERRAPVPPPPPRAPPPRPPGSAPVLRVAVPAPASAAPAGKPLPPPPPPPRSAAPARRDAPRVARPVAPARRPAASEGWKVW